MVRRERTQVVARPGSKKDAGTLVGNHRNTPHISDYSKRPIGVMLLWSEEVITSVGMSGECWGSVGKAGCGGVGKEASLGGLAIGSEALRRAV